jgi:hypothetical protein
LSHDRKQAREAASGGGTTLAEVAGMSRTACIALLLVALPATGLAEKKSRRTPTRSATRWTPDSWATADRTYDRAGTLRARVVRLDTTGEFDADDGMKKQRRELMRKDGTVKRETVSYAEQSHRQGASMSKSIAWRRKDGSVRFALGIGAGFGGGVRFHLRTPLGAIGKLPARALPRGRRPAVRRAR